MHLKHNLGLTREEKDNFFHNYIRLAESSNVNLKDCALNARITDSSTTNRREELTAARWVQLSIVFAISLRYIPTHICENARTYGHACVCVCALIYMRMYKEALQHVVRSHELVKQLILTFQHSSSMQLAYFMN